MRRVILPMLAGLLTAATAHGGDESATLRLTAVVEEARSANPEILAARERAAAAAAVPARVFAYDDPMFAYEAWNFPESFRLDQAGNNILKLSQKIPFPGKRTTARAAAEHDAGRAREAVGRAELGVVASARKAYYDLWRAHQNLLIYSRDRELVERLARISERRYAVGEVSQPDVLRAQVELTRLLNRVATETLAVDSARAELNAILSRSPDDPLGVPEDPPDPRLDVSVEALTGRALRDRPEIRAQRETIEREEAMVRMARLDYLPDFEVTVSRFLNFEAPNGFGVMGAVSIPLAWKSKYDAALAEARALLGVAKAELRRLEDRARREVRQEYLRARTALLQYDLFVTTHIPQSEQALEASDIGYRTGKIDFLSLIDSVRAVEEVHLEHIEAAAEFGKAVADLERVVGGELSAAEGDGAKG
ncbi:MAG: TolC family protein [Candidatus Binatia bacterium]